MIDKIIFTGLHRSGKTTMINKIMESNHNLTLFRSNSYDIDYNYFSWNMYLNCVNVYDRFIPFELMCGNLDCTLPIEFFKELLKNIKKYFENSLIVISKFSFCESDKNTEKVLEKTNTLIQILSELQYNFIVFNNYNDYNSFNIPEINHEINKIWFDDEDYSENVINFLNSLDNNFGWAFSRVGFNFEDLWNSLEYLRYICNYYKIKYSNEDDEYCLAEKLDNSNMVNWDEW